MVIPLYWFLYLNFLYYRGGVGSIDIDGIATQYVPVDCVHAVYVLVAHFLDVLVYGIALLPYVDTVARVDTVSQKQCPKNAVLPVLVLVDCFVMLDNVPAVRAAYQKKRCKDINTK